MADETLRPPPDQRMDCHHCEAVGVPFRWRPSTEAGPYWRCSECGEPHPAAAPRVGEMERELDGLVDAVRRLEADRDALRAEVAALKAGKWAGRWVEQGRWFRFDPRGTTAVAFCSNPYMDGRWRWWTDVNMNGAVAPDLEAAKAAADAALLAAGWYLDGGPVTTEGGADE